jgi:hypothetical protein
MPEVMQKRNFGRSGQSKHTTMKGEDTTDFSAPQLNKKRPRDV